MAYEYRIVETDQKPYWYQKVNSNQRPEKFYIPQYRSETKVKKLWFGRKKIIDDDWKTISFNSRARLMDPNATEVILFYNSDDYRKHIYYNFENYDEYAKSIDDAKEVIKQHKEFYNPYTTNSNRIVYEEYGLTKPQIERIIAQYTELLKTK